MSVFKNCYFFWADGGDTVNIQTSKSNYFKRSTDELGFCHTGDGDLKFLKDDENYYYPSEDCRKIQ